MAFPTAVNSQITDAVTQSNVSLVAEAPAVAMGSIYQSLAHSTGVLFENAVAAQQQQDTLGQAATNQGVMQIYGVDTIPPPGAPGKIPQAGVATNLTSLLAVLNAFRAQPAAQASAVATAPEAADASAAAPDDYAADVASQVQAAVRFSNEAVLGSANTFVSGLHAAVNEMARAIDAVNRVSHANLLRALHGAALSVTLAAMIREPQRAKEYEEVLQVIKRLMTGPEAP